MSFVKNIFLFCLIFSFSKSQNLNSVGSFSRIGTNAFGVSIGNATSSNYLYCIDGYSNPALLPSLSKKYISLTTNILTLDRNLFSFSYSSNIKPSAGIGFTALISKINNIDGRDKDGYFTENYSTTDQQYILSFANKFKNKFTIGINAKILYSKLFTDLTSTTVGFDIGTFYQLNDDLFLSFVIKDLNSNYKWDTSNLYNENGTSTINSFPIIYRLSATKLLLNQQLVLSFEIDRIDNFNNLIFRTGLSFKLNENIKLNIGSDRITTNKNNTATFATGFSFGNFKSFDKLILDYAFSTEPFNLFSRHVLTLNYTL